MASAINIPISVRNPVEAIRALRARAPDAIARALNRAGESASVAMSREISRDLKIRVGDARERIRQERATVVKFRTTLYASPKRIPLLDFGARPNEPPSRGQGRGVSANLGHGRVLYKGVFAARMKSGHVGIFRRMGKERKSAGAWSKNLPMTELHGPSIAKVFETHRHVGIARGQEQLAKNLQSEFRFAARRTS